MPVIPKSVSCVFRVCFIEGGSPFFQGADRQKFCDWICQELNRPSVTIIAPNAGDYPAICSGNGLRLRDLMACQWESLSIPSFSGEATVLTELNETWLFWWCAVMLCGYLQSRQFQLFSQVYPMTCVPPVPPFLAFSVQTHSIVVLTVIYLRLRISRFWFKLKLVWFCTILRFFFFFVVMRLHSIYECFQSFSTDWRLMEQTRDPNSSISK